VRMTAAPGRNPGRFGGGRGGRSGWRWLSPTGLRQALAILAITVAPIAAVVAISGAAVHGNADTLTRQQSTELTRAVAFASAAAYRASGWDSEDLDPVLDLVRRAGAAAQIQDPAGQVIGTSPGFARFSAGQVHRQPVVTSSRTVGLVTVKVGHQGLAAAIDQYRAFPLEVGIAAAAAAALMALLVLTLVSRTLTRPVDRLIETARAWEAGDIAARVGPARGVQELRQLSAAFDQAADAISEQGLVRRKAAADLAHEFRAPIAVLRAGLEAMQDGLTEPTPDALAGLHEEVGRLTDMADDLSALGSGRPPALHLQLAKHDLAALAAEAADSLAGAFQAADVRLIRRLAPIEVVCDARRAHEVIVNLLGNAVKFTGAGGRVVLETGPAPESGQHAVLRVRDTGIGIPADELPHVSRRFFRGRRATGYSGTGIGLAIVDELARAQHGSMNIVSEPGRGTQVAVMLPRALG
jgi:two-component system, OmpR family, sensor histidine kinase BaeS